MNRKLLTTVIAILVSVVLFAPPLARSAPTTPLLAAPVSVVGTGGSSANHTPGQNGGTGVTEGQTHGGAPAFVPDPIEPEVPKTSFTIFLPLVARNS